MCGIFGYWSRSRTPLADAALETMAQKLVHRGPDDQGIWHQPQRGVGIGNRRLSIIDIGGGHQPFVSDDCARALTSVFAAGSEPVEAGGVPPPDKLST